MSTTFGSIDAIKTERSKLLIQGYIKMMQTGLFAEKNDNPYYNIPTLIIHICIWFYNEIDRFSISGHCFKISENGDSVTCIDESDRHSAFGTIGIDLSKINNVIYRWDLKIDRLQDVYEMNIGVVSNRRQQYLMGDFCVDIMGDDIYFAVEQWGYVESNSDSDKIDNCNKFRQGDIVSIQLNTNKRNISYYINNVQQGIAYKNIEQKIYYLALTFRSEGNCVKILDFVETYI